MKMKNGFILTCDFCGRAVRCPDGEPLPPGWILLTDNTAGASITSCCGDPSCGAELQAGGAVLDEDDPAWGGSEDMEYTDEEIADMAEED